MEFLMTLDVESFSIPLNRCDSSTGERVWKIGIPLIINLLSKYDVKATFYFTGEFAEIVPNALDFVSDHDHEIGCHGYDHTPDRAFDVLSYEEQLTELKRARRLIEGITGGRITSFRAPMLRINEDTIRALETAGFKTDSSVCPQRFDGPFTFGSRRKLRWLISPRMPYHPSRESVFRRGDSKILEIPISAMILPFIGTTIRMMPNVLRLLRKMLFIESRISGKPVVLLFHPNECIDYSEVKTTRRARDPVSFFFADYLRQRLKLKNLGRKAIGLIEDVLRSARDFGFDFVCAEDFRRMYDGGFRAR